ncbi:MAG: HlyD family efflux transporter periplasmic adaptor subunit [Candidatus Caenarcaniphilales bacterium]|nr:HlyD family efflux transporter periplasmic adaptor subunit [Candidatus Caenarcaniphilales bacterium]
MSKFKSKELVKTPKWVRTSATNLLILFIVSVLALLLIPWQQTVVGSGAVTSLNPENRPQFIEAPIHGRIEKWYVKEGQKVKKGQTLIKLKDLDKNFLADDLVKLNKEKAKQVELSRELYLTKANSLERTISTLRANMKNELEIAKQELEAAKADLETAVLNYNRIIELNEIGLSSQREKELAIRKRNSTQAKVLGAEAKLSQLRGKMQAEMLKLQSELDSANAEAAKLSGVLAESNLKLRTATERREIGVVKAPCNGFVVRVLKRGIGETFKQNEKIMVIAPETKDRAVELFLNDLDSPLVTVGERVRLQFSGWPALQFAGFSDTLSFGTFAGRVAVVDNVDSGKGYFRVLVVPDNEEGPWPPSSMLRLGTRASGWIILRTVSLGYEMWRRFSGIPIALVDVNDKEGEFYGSDPLLIDPGQPHTANKKLEKIYDKKPK